MPEPWPKKKPKACMMVMRGKMRPTPAVAKVPMRPTKKVSAMLYRDEISMEAMVGPARRRMSPFTGWVVMRVSLSVFASMVQASLGTFSQRERR